MRGGEGQGMRGVWWAALLLGGLIGGIAGAAIMFGLTQAFGGSSHSGATTAAAHGSSARSGDTSNVVARNGVDAETVFNAVKQSVVTIDTNTRQRRGSQQGEGTGIVLDTAGHILTNDHVIDQVQTISVTTSDGRSYDASVVATDQTNDLAVIKINAPAASLHPATFGDPSRLQVGEPVLALGNPLGYESTLTEGIVSGLDRTFDDGVDQPMNHLIQSDAAINPGNSGGPLLTADGAVVGVNTLLDNADGSDTFSGIGFAVPVNLAQDVFKQAGVTVTQ